MAADLICGVTPLSPASVRQRGRQAWMQRFIPDVPVEPTAAIMAADHRERQDGWARATRGGPVPPATSQPSTRLRPPRRTAGPDGAGPRPSTPFRTVHYPLGAVASAPSSCAIGCTGAASVDSAPARATSAARNRWACLRPGTLTRRRGARRSMLARSGVEAASNTRSIVLP